MNKFIKSIFSFSVIALCLYPILIIIWGLIMPKFLKSNFSNQLGSFGFTHTRIRDIKNYKNVDILFLGSSHAYKGFDTRIFTKNGISSFNLGTSGQTPLQTEVLVKRYLKLLNPKLIVYEVYPSPFCSDGVGSSLDLIANDYHDQDMFNMVLKTNHIKTYHSYVYCLFADLMNLNSSYVEKTTRRGDKYIKGGYTEQKLQFYKHTKTSTKNINFNPVQVEAFSRINEQVKNEDYNICFVFAPITDSLYSNYNLKDYRNFIESYGAYYDFNNIKELDDSLHFFDSHHLNQNGVKIFNKHFISYFKKNHLIKPNY